MNQMGRRRRSMAWICANRVAGIVDGSRAGWARSDLLCHAANVGLEQRIGA